MLRPEGRPAIPNQRTDVDLRSQVAASIRQTLREQARVNELTIARIRIPVMVAMCAVEALFAIWGPLEGGAVEAAMRLSTLVYLGVAIWFHRWLAAGGFRPELQLAVPAADALYVLLRMQATFTLTDPSELSRVQELSTLGLTAAVITLTGAYRISDAAIAASAAAAGVLYAWFAFQLGLPVPQLVLHLFLLAGLAATGHGLTVIVGRAAQSEVARMTVSRMLPAHVMDRAHEDPLSLLTLPRSVEATVLMTDVRGFTRWAESHTPMDVLGFLNVVQGVLSEAVRDHGGTVDKFIGDGMLAVFGAIEPLPDHRARAVAAAAQMQRAIRELNRTGQLDSEVRIGVGIHCGEIVVGCIGSGERLEFTVLGDTVNLASRLEQMTKEHPHTVLMSASVAAGLGSDLVASIGEVAIRGRDAPLQVYTLARGPG